MKIIEKKLGDLIPYENNPRNNDGAVDAVAASIKEFGFTELDPKYCDVIIQRYINLKGSSDDVYLIDGDKRIPYAEVFK